MLTEDVSKTCWRGPKTTMKRDGGDKARRVGIWFDLDWGVKRELDVYAGCQRYADEMGWKCTIDPAIARSLRAGSGELPYDGILTRVTQPIADAACKAGVPVVNVWLNSPVKGIPSVLTDFETSGAMAAEHLLGRGFRQFGYLGFQRLLDVQQQLKGFRAVLRKEGFRCSSYRFPHTLLDRDASGWESFVAGLRAWVDELKPPVGILVGQDLYCRFLIDVCRSKGLHVPGDVAIVGCGNEASMCSSPPPSLTSIDEGHEQKGYRAAALLDRLMNGAAPPDGPELVADVFAVDDPLVARAMRFMADNSHRVLNVPEVANAVATSRRTLERRFRAAVGRSIAEEMIRLRLNRAKRRLVETDTPMKTVALDAGFRTANHFSKVFSRVEGISPSRYREERQKVFLESEG